MIAQPLDTWKYVTGSSEGHNVAHWSSRAAATAVPQHVVKTPGAANV
jgi:hypothetical protein